MEINASTLGNPWSARRVQAFSHSPELANPVRHIPSFIPEHGRFTAGLLRYQGREDGMDQCAEKKEHAGSLVNAQRHPDPTKPCAHLKEDENHVQHSQK